MRYLSDILEEMNLDTYVVGGLVYDYGIKKVTNLLFIGPEANTLFYKIIGEKYFIDDIISTKKTSYDRKSNLKPEENIIDKYPLDIFLYDDDMYIFFDNILSVTTSKDAVYEDFNLTGMMDRWERAKKLIIKYG